MWQAYLLYMAHLLTWALVILIAAISLIVAVVQFIHPSKDGEKRMIYLIVGTVLMVLLVTWWK